MSEPNVPSSPPGPILIISGTNRPESHALKIARILESHYRRLNVPAVLFSLADLPAEVFLPAAYAQKPPAMVALQRRVVDALGLHLVVPEYNGSFPGALKYFIDMLKFPESFDAKPVAFIGEAAGAWGAIRAVEQLQMVFGYRNAHSFPDRVFIPGVHQKLDAAGNFTDDAIAQRVARQVEGFARYASHLELHCRTR